MYSRPENQFIVNEMNDFKFEFMIERNLTLPGCCVEIRNLPHITSFISGVNVDDNGIISGAKHAIGPQ